MTVIKEWPCFILHWYVSAAVHIVPFTDKTDEISTKFIGDSNHGKNNPKYDQTYIFTLNRRSNKCMIESWYGKTSDNIDDDILQTRTREIIDR